MLVGYEMTIANSYLSRGYVSSEYSCINDSYKYTLYLWLRVNSLLNLSQHSLYRYETKYYQTFLNKLS